VTRATQARLIITERYLDGMRQGLEGPALHRYINDGYSWGERRYHPYKVWLDVFKEMMGVGPTGQPRVTKEMVAAHRAIEAGQGVML